MTGILLNLRNSVASGTCLLASLPVAEAGFRDVADKVKEFAAAHPTLTLGAAFALGLSFLFCVLLKKDDCEEEPDSSQGFFIAPVSPKWIEKSARRADKAVARKKNNGEYPIDCGKSIRRSKRIKDKPSTRSKSPRDWLPKLKIQKEEVGADIVFCHDSRSGK